MGWTRRSESVWSIPVPPKTRKDCMTTLTTRKEDKLRPYRVDYFDISEMKENDLALVKSVVVRAVTAAEAIYHDDVAQQGRIIIRCYRYYKTLGAHKKDVFKAVEDLFTANKAIKIMAAV